jgi:coproporphyrinogen III oxidase
MNKRSEASLEKKGVLMEKDGYYTSDLISERFRELQLYICRQLEIVDGLAKFNEDAWARSEGGGGFTRTITGGKIIEKGGVAYSVVHGEVNETMRAQMKIDGNTFFATGVSIVLHPRSPHVPIIHMNVRYFELDNGTCWFGGGIDLTPHYVVEENAVKFHRRLKDICDKFNAGFYSKFKPWADTYFHIPHRGESRGIGGIFYDHLVPTESLTKRLFMDFAIELGEQFPVIYGEQVELGKDLPITEDQLRWRNLRRGRYVEFNLVHDRGTKFGLISNGRTESILMSLPPDASWEYQNEPPAGSKERHTLEILSTSKDWLNITE